ncbi:MAG: hypothetical protein J2P21_01005 [Chloracidobacterium sp.]|nr:hypothetical protein [Chloracidobacterium sp.]
MRVRAPGFVPDRASGDTAVLPARRSVAPTTRCEYCVSPSLLVRRKQPGHSIFVE